ncbi:hypothetical protein E1211_23890 [Micromonospora sp. 15K316]|uniref:hypothetical protein n=1 Tax=Micromonospora sp. 15K316 TaxID=2530376 RepID=UPI001046E28B|nr:hypothetical protein [Micromonospora sp. 15K316]TDC30632.1 hypothetical protein E1211_23890 [Micromonospora sp. 15K316]
MSGVEVRLRHQDGLAALYLGVFATVWFSVPAAEQPLRGLLVAGSVAALFTAVAGGVVTARSRGAAAGPRDRADDRRYLLIVLAEFALAGLGAAALTVAGWPEYIPVLVCAVVGLHFFPLAPLLGNPLLRHLGVATCAVALAGLLTGLLTAVPAGVVVGTGAGALLLGYALRSLVRGVRG